MWCEKFYAVVLLCACVSGRLINAEEDDSALDDSTEHLGATVTTVMRHPYVATLLRNGTYNCSATILNEYWLVTYTKCFQDDVINAYVSQKSLDNYTVRVGSSYNNKGGTIYKVKMLINNFDLKVSAVKVNGPIVMSDQVDYVQLPTPDSEPLMGYGATMIAWTPSGHMRAVNAPVIEPSLCESITRLLPGHAICLGGVQDPNRHFCRRDNGGAITQNGTLIGLATFQHTCALYTKPHSFPKASSFSRWLESVIWDEGNKPSTDHIAATTISTEAPINITDSFTENSTPYFEGAKNFMLTLPFEPIDVPLEPNGVNSVIPRLSLYESYLQNIQRSRTSTSTEPHSKKLLEAKKRAWLAKINNAIMMMPAPSYTAKRLDGDLYDYNN